ncbi:MAG: SDR family NAD(P)-dependent oxidoreductase [Acidimicrobiales bacterium]|jgi:decaprenylphospho-beta-D-erythro-pentofuranosid-2-ulose 2-reductase
MNDALGMPQTAVVLGGTSDIARSVMRGLAARRLRHVVLAGRDQTELEDTAKELRALGIASVEAITWDATDDEAHTALAQDVAGRMGQVDLVLVAVGVLGDQEVCESDPGATASVLSTNLTGPAAAMVAFAQILRRQGQGRLVVMSSVAGVRVRRANFVYGASKAGLDAFAQGLAEALRPTGAGVTIVRPGWVATRMTAGRPPAPMATTPEAVAADIIRGLERRADVVWSPASLKMLFAVLRLLPKSVWRLVPG